MGITRNGPSPSSNRCVYCSFSCIYMYTQAQLACGPKCLRAWSLFPTWTLTSHRYYLFHSITNVLIKKNETKLKKKTLIRVCIDALPGYGLAHPAIRRTGAACTYNHDLVWRERRCLTRLSATCPHRRLPCQPPDAHPPRA